MDWGFRRYNEIAGQGATYFVHDLGASGVPDLAPLVAKYDTDGNLIAKITMVVGLIAMSRDTQPTLSVRSLLISSMFYRDGGAKCI